MCKISFILIETKVNIGRKTLKKEEQTQKHECRISFCNSCQTCDCFFSQALSSYNDLVLVEAAFMCLSRLQVILNKVRYNAFLVFILKQDFSSNNLIHGLSVWLWLTYRLTKVIDWLAIWQTDRQIDPRTFWLTDHAWMNGRCISLSVCLSVCLSVSVCLSLSEGLSFYLPVLHVCLSVYRSHY